MSKKEIQRRKIARYVMLEAWRLKRGTVLYKMSFSSSLRLSWKIIRGQIKKHYTKIVGVTFQTRQRLLQRLLNYQRYKVIIKFVREHGNPYDEHATLIFAEVKGKGEAAIGYLKSELAATIAPIIDSGRQVVVSSYDITGGYNKIYGCNISYFII